MLKYATLCINHLKTQSATLLSNQTDLLMQQTRNTYILKRRYPVPLHKKNQRPRPMKAKYFIYDVVENVTAKKKKMIDLILLETVEGYGLKGQQVSVPSDKAYNNLVLPKLATYATPENIKKYTITEEQKQELQIYSSKFVPRTLSVLSQCYLSVIMSKDIPWTIEKWHIRTSFRKAGIIVPEDAIILPEKPISGPNLSIQNKEFYVIVKINNVEEVKVRCKIHHWQFESQFTEKIDLTPFWDLPSIAIFPEDQPILDSLPKHKLCKNSTTDY